MNNNIINIKDNNILLVNYIYSLTKEIYTDKQEIQSHIIDSNKSKPVSTSYLKIRAESIKARAEAIINVCKNIEDIQADQFRDIDNLKERSKVIESLKVYFS